MRIIDHTAARRGFDTQDETYYRELFQAYGSQVKLILAEMDLSAYQRALRKEQMQKQTELSEIQGYSRKRVKHQKMLREELDQLQQKLREVRQLEPYAQEGKVLMGGGIFICYGQEMIYLAGGTYGRFLHFHPAYAMQWHMIRAAKHAGLRAYNFYGISGLFEKDQDGYGVFAFKRGFHADVIELLGDFLMPLRPWAWRAPDARAEAPYQKTRLNAGQADRLTLRHRSSETCRKDTCRCNDSLFSRGISGRGSG